MILFISIYLLTTIGIGIYASKKVKNSKDFLLAGRKLPVYITSAALFATWFGSETVMGASAQMAENGLSGVIEDPFGASLCLILLGLFFARPLYRLNVNTLGDLFRDKFGKTAEKLASFFIIISYFGWIAAQMLAMGLLFHWVLKMDVSTGIIAGSVIVVLYTITGGMWSVSLTDFVQSIFIIIGLIATLLAINNVLDVEFVLSELPVRHQQFFPDKSGIDYLNYFAAFITLGLGSLPQQDVYQRVASARSENTAVSSSFIAAFLYLSIGLIPLYLGAAAKLLYPETDPQLLIIKLISEQSGIVINVLFFGALISAIMSTTSGAILAPAAILSENIFPAVFKIKTERKLLFNRISVLIIATISLLMALGKNNIYELVSESSALSLVSLFVPLILALFIKKRSGIAANFSMISGMGIWITALFLETQINPVLYGLSGSITAYFSVIIVQHLHSYFNKLH